MAQRVARLSKVPLAFPSVISLRRVEGQPVRSWIQLATIGKFVSNRYGKFEITKDDLRSMYRNFRDVTPKAPTELPVDYDHLSMEPAKPGDGVAAGWFKNLQLRSDDSELWGEVEWTDTAADKIEKREYRYVSPSFVKDHTHKDGRKIGTTLLAAAVTNHPFLEGMKALTLYSFSALGDLALSERMIPRRIVPVISLAEVGQRVMVAPGDARTADEVGGTFEITEIVGDGDDAFVSLKDAQGNVHKWFRATELLPASATPASPQRPSLQPNPSGAASTMSGAANPEAAVAAKAAKTMGAAMGLDPAADPAAAAAAGAPGADGAAGKDKANPFAKGAAGADGGDKKNPFAKGEGDPKDPNEEGATGEENVNGTAEAGKPQRFEKKAATPDPTADPLAAMMAAAATGGSPASPDKKPVDPLAKPSGGIDNDDVMAAIRKAMAALLAEPKKGTVNMTFKLRNDKNEEIELSADQLRDQLEAAGVKTVPEGSVAVPATELKTLNESVISLTTAVAALKAEGEGRVAQARQNEVATSLRAKLDGGYMTRPTHDALLAQFKDVSDLTGFHALMNTFTTQIVKLNTEHGHGVQVPNAESQGAQAQQRIIDLSNKLVKDSNGRMDLRTATIEASRMLADDSAAYLEEMATPGR